MTTWNRQSPNQINGHLWLRPEPKLQSHTYPRQTFTVCWKFPAVQPNPIKIFHSKCVFYKLLFQMPTPNTRACLLNVFFSLRQLQTSSKRKSKVWTGFCHQVQSPNSHGSIMNWRGPLQDTHSSHTHQKVARLLESSQRLMREGLKSWGWQAWEWSNSKTSTAIYSPNHTHTSSQW